MTHRRLVAAILLLSLCLAAQARAFKGVVTHVSDGDSLWIRAMPGGAPREVRVQGIDAPEICQPFGRQARDALAGQVLHRVVTVNTRARDVYQRVLAHVSIGGQDVGAWMVARGYAWAHGYQRRSGSYAAYQAQARSARLGLWAQPGPVEPREFRKRHGSCR